MHPTERFYAHLDILLDALDDDVSGFEDNLADALKALEAYDWDKNNPPLKPHGVSGEDFSFPINAEFVLVVRRETDRVEHKPTVVHLYLKTIERTKS